MRPIFRLLCVLALGWGLVGAAAMAQAPDCTGISPVLNTDPDLDGELTTVLIASGLSSPVLALAAPGDNERLFIVEQPGRIRIVKNGALENTPFLAIEPLVNFGGEQGLLGLAFHPDYATNGYFFVYYTNNSGNQQIVRYQRLTADLADSSSDETVITVSHPGASNHNGGMIAFSPIDGHLYIGTGDGGGGCDPGPFGNPNAQNLNNNLGKMLRLDVDTLPPTTDGNPFDGPTAGNDEIWAYGLRNPWRWSFDRITGNLYIGDVGQFVWEEIDCARPGGNGGENYGWVLYEGNQCPPTGCSQEGSCNIDYVPPIVEYNQSGSPCAVTGGYVYRGCRMPDLHGTYFYSDACDPFVNTFRTGSACNSDGPFLNRESDLATPGTISSIVGFGEDNQGELYLVSLNGQVYKILPELTIVEVSGAGATPLLIGAGGAFSWEDIAASSGHAIQRYKVYRSSDPTSTFSCVHQGSPTTWSGDPTVPAVNEVFYYLVTARGAGGETVPGAGSDGTPRSVDTASLCSP